MIAAKTAKRMAMPSFPVGHAAYEDRDRVRTLLKAF